MIPKQFHIKSLEYNFKRDNIAVVNSHGRGSGGVITSQTPHRGSNTPNYHAGSRTPAHGSQTPRADGSRTPSYGGDGSRTPQYEGSQTPRGGDNPWSSKSKFIKLSRTFYDFVCQFQIRQETNLENSIVQILQEHHHTQQTIIKVVLSHLHTDHRLQVTSQQLHFRIQRHHHLVHIAQHHRPDILDQHQ